MSRNNLPAPDENGMTFRIDRATIVVGILAVAVRMIAITQPYVDGWSWRQSDVAAIARNYYQFGFHFAYPQIDWAGDAPGFVGTECPIQPFAAALVYKLIGVHDWIGRAGTVLLFAFSLPFFYLLVKRTMGKTAAFWALLFYSFAPLGIVAGRSFMPDTPALSLSLAGLYYFLRALEKNQLSYWLAAGALIALALLIKIPGAVIGLPLFYLAYRRYGFALFKQARLWAFSAAVLLPALLWYWHAYRISKLYYPYHFFGAGGIQVMSLAYYWKILIQIATSSLTPLLFGLAVIGLLLTLRSKGAGIFRWWLGATILFIIVAGHGNRHQWYHLALVPIAAAFAGATLDLLARKSPHRRVAFGVTIAILTTFGVLAIKYTRPFYTSWAEPQHRLGVRLDNITPPTVLIIAVDEGDPTILYYAHRRGWHFVEDGLFIGPPTDSVQAIGSLEKLRKRRAEYIAFHSGTFWWLDYYKEFAAHLRQTAQLVEANTDYAIYRLSEAPAD